MSQYLAIDVGATGIKGAIIDVEKGQLQTERIKLATPKPATPDKIADTIDELVKQIGFEGTEIGIGFPAIIKNGLCLTASNIDDSWININIPKLIKNRSGLTVHVLNDADAAGIAEMTYGKGKGKKGTVIMLTLGSGIGSAFFKDGALLPNIELGRMYYRESVAEHYASNSARKTKDLSWEVYGKELNEFLEYTDRIFSPDLIIIGGGISKKFAKYSEYINPKLNVTPAEFQNNAGIIGAAMFAAQKIKNG